MNPKSQDVLKVIKNFEKIPYSTRIKPQALSMGRSDVKTVFSRCGTVMCHGGWYAAVACRTFLNFLDFKDGAHKMAQHLGFPNSEGLVNWAQNNPEIWGNSHGAVMFADAIAFGCSLDPFTCPRVNTIQEIVEHWKRVYNRLVEIEKREKLEGSIVKTITYSDITEELAVLPEDTVETDVKVKELQ